MIAVESRINDILSTRVAEGVNRCAMKPAYFVKGVGQPSYVMVYFWTGETSFFFLFCNMPWYGRMVYYIKLLAKVLDVFCGAISSFFEWLVISLYLHRYWEVRYKLWTRTMTKILLYLGRQINRQIFIIIAEILKKEWPEHQSHKLNDSSPSFCKPVGVYNNLLQWQVDSSSVAIAYPSLYNC